MNCLINASDILLSLNDDFTFEDYIKEYKKISGSKVNLYQLQVDIDNLIKSGEIRKISEDPDIYLKRGATFVPKVNSEDSLLKKPEAPGFNSKIYRSVEKHFTKKDVEIYSSNPGRLIKSWIKKGVVEESPDGSYIKIGEETVSRDTIPEEIISGLAEEVISRILTGKKNIDFPLRALDGSEDMNPITKEYDALAERINERTQEYIIKNKFLLLPIKKVSYNISPSLEHRKKIELCLSEDSEDGMYTKLFWYIDAIVSGGIEEQYNLEYLVRFIRSAYSIILSDKRKFRRKPEDKIDRILDTLKIYEDIYIEKYSYIYPGNCTYCKERKLFSFIRQEHADQFVQENQDKFFSRDILDKKLPPDEIKLLYRSYYSGDCGCYHVTSKPEKSNRDKDNFIRLYGEKLIDLIKSSGKCIPHDYKMSLLCYLRKRLLERKNMPSGDLKIKEEFPRLIEECDRLMEFKEDVKKVIEKEMKTSITKKTEEKKILDYESLWGKITEAFVLGDYTEVRKLITEGRNSIKELSGAERKEKFSEIINYLGKLGFIELRLEDLGV